MSPVWWAACLAALAVALLVPHPAGDLRRLRPEGARPRLLRRVARLRCPNPATRGGEVADALGFLAVCLDAGLPMVRALSIVADASAPATSAVLRRLSSELTLGRRTDEAWGALRGDPVWGAAAADVARAERSGLCLADLLRLHADDARRVAADRATLAARTVGVRSVVPLMVCFLPAFILVGVVPIVAGLVADFMG